MLVGELILTEERVAMTNEEDLQVEIAAVGMPMLKGNANERGNEKEKESGSANESVSVNVNVNVSVSVSANATEGVSGTSIDRIVKEDQNVHPGIETMRMPNTTDSSMKSMMMTTNIPGRPGKIQSMTLQTRVATLSTSARGLNHSQKQILCRHQEQEELDELTS